jgi:hypothetical protein
MHARKQYLAEVRKEYERADQRDRSKLLDEAEKRSGYHRKYLVRVLNAPLRPSLIRPRSYRDGSVNASMSVADSHGEVAEVQNLVGIEDHATPSHPDRTRF